MAHFPNETPHVMANKKVVRESGDYDEGSLFIERPDADRVIVTVRSPRQTGESSISLSLEDFRKLIAPHL